MNAKDQFKLIQNGYTIIRARDFKSIRNGVVKERFEIFAKTREKSEWHSLEWQFKSKAERDRRIRVLRELQFIIED